MMMRRRMRLWRGENVGFPKWRRLWLRCFCRGEWRMKGEAMIVRCCPLVWRQSVLFKLVNLDSESSADCTP